MENSRVEPTTFFMKKNVIFFETLSGNFYGQSFIKTVRGPLEACMYFVCNCIKFKESVLNHFQNLRKWGEKAHFKIFFLPYWCTTISSLHCGDVNSQFTCPNI